MLKVCRHINFVLLLLLVITLLSRSLRNLLIILSTARLSCHGDNTINYAHNFEKENKSVDIVTWEVRHPPMWLSVVLDWEHSGTLTYLIFKMRIVLDFML